MRIALAVPCAAHIAERLAGLKRLEYELLGTRAPHLSHEWGPAVYDSGLRTPIQVVYKAFTDREKWYPISVTHPDGEGPGWFLRMLRWASTTDADFFVTLQDDVTAAPNFWPALVAMIEAWGYAAALPEVECLSLASNHSQAREQARQGRRSYFTNPVVGWAWGLPMPVLQEFLRWCDSGYQLGYAISRWRAAHPLGSEDTMLAEWLMERKIAIRHPLPTIVDHLYTKSTFEGNDLHSHRRSVGMWRDYSPRDMAEPSWWRGYAAELPLDIARVCAWCGDREAAAYSPRTHIGLCVECMPRALCQWCGKGSVVARAPDTGFGICKGCFMMPGRVFQPFLPTPGGGGNK